MNNAEPPQQPAPREVTFRLVGEHRDGGQLSPLAKSKSLQRLASRIEKDGEFWYEMGWENISLEDNSLGDFSLVLMEDLRSRFERKEIAAKTWKVLSRLILG